MDNTNIGVAVAGRHPGYQVFGSVNWQGPAPVDADQRSRCLTDRYYSVAFDGFWANYELAICNFVSSSARDEAFRICLRIPFGNMIVNHDGNQVSAKRVLDLISEKVEAVMLERRGSTFRIPKDIIRPVIPESEIAGIISNYSLVPRWGGSMCMNGSANSVLVNTDEKDIGLLISKLPMCERLSSASEVCFGKFRGDSSFAFTQSERNAEPPVYVGVRCFDGSIKKVPLENSQTFKSGDYGFDAACFNPAEITIQAKEVLECWTRKLALPESAGVSTRFNAKEATVELSFEPEEKEMIVRLKIVGLTDSDEASFLSSARTSLMSGSFEPFPTSGIVLRGMKITEFLHRYADPAVLKSTFSIDSKCNCQITGVSLVNGSIHVNARRKPEPPNPKNIPVVDAVGLSCGSVLKMELPSAIPPMGSCYVHIAPKPGCEAQGYSIIRKMEFKPDAHGIQSAEIAVPDDFQRTIQQVMLGTPAQYFCDSVVKDGNCFFAREFRKKRFIGRIAEIFSYKLNYTLSNSDYLVRITGLLLAGLLLLFAGYLLGMYTGNAIRDAIASTAERIETTVNNTSSDVETLDAAGEHNEEVDKVEPAESPVAVPVQSDSIHQQDAEQSGDIDLGRTHGSNPDVEDYADTEECTSQSKEPITQQ